MLARFLQSKLFLALEVTVLILTVVSFARVREKKKAIQAEIDNLSAEVALRKDEQQELLKLHERNVLGAQKELEVKRKLNYRKPGEIVFVFYEDALEKEVVREGVEQQKASEEFSNPARWWRYFFK
jgi:hypothetical protein